MKDYEKEYELFWKSIVENEDGTLNLDQIKRELYDYGELMHAASTVYCEITNSRISKPNTDPYDVISVANDVINDMIDEAIKEYQEEIDGNE